MPTYPKGTRQWAEELLKECASRRWTHFADYESERDFLIESLERGLPDGAPTYSPAELEAAGQLRIEL